MRDEKWKKKKLKLSISGTSKKTISSIEKAKSQSKNTVLIEKKSSRFGNKKTASRLTRPNDKFKSKTSFHHKSSEFGNACRVREDTDRISTCL